MKLLIEGRWCLGVALLVGAMLAGGCGTPRERELAGLYVLNTSAVRDSAAEQIDDIEDPSQQMAMGMALTMLQSLNVFLHLEPDGTAYVTGIEPQQRGTWSARRATASWRCSASRATTGIGTRARSARGGWSCRRAGRASCRSSWSSSAGSTNSEPHTPRSRHRRNRSPDRRKSGRDQGAWIFDVHCV